MKSMVIAFLALGTLVATIFCSPVVPQSSGTSGEVICNRNGCIFPKKDYGPTVTPYTPTMKPRFRTLIVPPLRINSTWMDIDNKPSTESPLEEDSINPVSSDNDSEANEEDNMV